ncbi:uncharacterized protein LOC106652832 [Trichogramma pretiosum]|uniref:uncharacterized protein LOC106652832 n=1 Tax=Trichogramma pretiosum TaxID=7493 RepID=UPI0006C9B95F|nr:uncharacterized protein LOC106652832 [Trichogramma pretiosum]
MANDDDYAVYNWRDHSASRGSAAADRATRNLRLRGGGGLQRNRRASSDGELAQQQENHHQQQQRGGREVCLFHEGLDVDQLARYRRRQTKPVTKDHLGYAAEREQRGRRRRQQQQRSNSDEDEDENDKRRLVTEYRLRFHAADSIENLFENEDVQLTPETAQLPDQTDQFEQKNPDAISETNSRASISNPMPDFNDETQIDFPKVTNEKQPIERVVDEIKQTETTIMTRPALIRRGTTLRNEGDFTGTTEYSRFVPHLGFHRAELRRRGTSLRMEGDFQRERSQKVGDWPATSRDWFAAAAGCRPAPVRIPSNLRLEGDMQTTTESHDQYVPFIGVKRPELLRQAAQLGLEGDNCWAPEYSDVFKKHNFLDRRLTKKAETHPKPDSGFFEKTEATNDFSNSRNKEFELMANLSRDAEEEDEELKKREEEQTFKNKNEYNLRKEEELKLLVSKLEDLNGNSLDVPEYQAAYKNFPRERPKLIKPADEIGHADGSKISTMPSPRRFKTKIDQDPEYKSIFLNPEYKSGSNSDLTRDRAIFYKPPHPLRPSISSSRASLRMDSVNNRRGSRMSMAPMSEIRSQYVNYGHVPRTENLRIPTSLKLEGNINLEPEYRDAFCMNNNNHNNNIGHQRRMSRVDQSSTMINDASKNRRESGGGHWAENYSGDCFGAINASESQDAFQILHTRVHEESVVEKPPPGNRRLSQSRSSLVSVNSQQLESTTKPPPAALQNRSPSPSYRLQVTHVDKDQGAAGGFAMRSRRSPSTLVHPTNIERSPSPINQIPADRPYSPSFARENSAASVTRSQAFVVLQDDHREAAAAAPSRHRRKSIVDRGSGYNNRHRDSLAGVTRPTNRTPTNWMPPWYDSSTSTI